MSNFKVFVNFKTYAQGTGERAVELAKICQEASASAKASADKQEIEIIPVVQTTDVFRIKKAVDIPVWVQHLDWQKQGAFTGWQNLEAAIEAGASGTLLNHSEHQIPPGTVKQFLSAVDSRLKTESRFETMVCCKTLGQMEKLVKLKPDYIGYEISELIGGKVSIADYNSKAIKHAVGICGQTPLIIGSGINKSEDLRRAKQLGSCGILISSAILLTKNTKEKLREITKLVG